MPKAYSPNKTLSKNILWKNQNISLIEEVIKFHEDDTREITDLDTTYQFFKYLWTEEIISNIYEDSKRYAIQKNPSKPLTISENEINQYLGICIYASLVHLPNYRAYWSEELGFDRIKETMISGFAYKLELYSDQQNNEKYRLNGELDLDASANVVIRLARIIRRNKNYTLYFDNCYISIPLLA
ncbi:uncharacterized protein LOC118182953 [Stegodyphus dumicola]|uniref:uncharacterized protein LOC118182953 n=1 Tax=Stegodyphus dumicola TaxID=202533 RepID=UPI0015ACA6FA|nr:uncharacterized protein LOC118182953 [Stegodyphus dumicola]